MNKIRSTIIFSIILASAVCFLSSCSKNSKVGMIVFTRTSLKTGNFNFKTGDFWRFIPQGQIAIIDPKTPQKSLKILTGDFYSACSPVISYDGKNLLFSAQKKQNDPWQIWEMDLNDLKTRQLINSKENCIDPDYLPGGRVVFSMSTPNDTLKAGYSLYTFSLDGGKITRITFNPDTYFASRVLYDGRVLTLAKQVFPDEGDQMFMVLRPDGTKAEMFYKEIKGNNLISCGSQTDDERIVFIERDKANPEKGKLISIGYNRPLHSRVNLTDEIKGDFNSVFPKSYGKLLVTYRTSPSERYGLYEFDTENKELGTPVYTSPDFDILEAVVTGAHTRPKKLPSEVDTGVKTGLLLCQDLNISDMHGVMTNSSFTRSTRIEIVGLDSTLGFVDAEEDGSFYLKVMADKPFKIQTIDKQGNILNSSCNWIWLRPNERRGCVGCHEDPEMSPENRVPLSVKKSPVVIPMHINKVVEKKVSLE
jgi:hypothetical protein